MFMHPEDFLSMEKMRHAELIRQRDLERSARAAHPRKTRHWGIGGHPGAKAMARQTWHAVIALFTIRSRHRPPPPFGMRDPSLHPIRRQRSARNSSGVHQAGEAAG